MSVAAARFSAATASDRSRRTEEAGEAAADDGDRRAGR